jgi:hypothetical protein
MSVGINDAVEPPVGILGQCDQDMLLRLDCNDRAIAIDREEGQWERYVKKLICVGRRAMPQCQDQESRE